MKLKPRFTKALCMALFMSLLLLESTTAFAQCDKNEADEGNIIMVAIPDKNGELQFYKGVAAQKMYDRFQSGKDADFNVTMNKENREKISGSDIAHPDGSFSYKYRFITDSSGYVNGVKTRISPYACNSSSTAQSMSLSASTSQTWSIDVNLKGQFKKAFDGSVGAGWKTTSSFSEMLTINVPAKKRVWLQFQPRFKYVKGRSQKYYVTRGAKKVTVVEKSIPVYSKSPTTVNLTIGGKRIKCPDGAYIWREDNKYNNG